MPAKTFNLFELNTASFKRYSGGFSGSSISLEGISKRSFQLSALIVGRLPSKSISASLAGYIAM
jgi:hypothetical protein